MNTVATPKPSRRRPELAVAGLIVLAAALYFGYSVASSYFAQLRAHTSFVPVSATVVASSLKTRGSASATNGESQYPHIVYRYTVAGTTYESDRYFFTGLGWSNAADATSVLARYPAGSTVQAYVDQASPAVAVLDTTKPSPGMLFFLLPLVLVGVAATLHGMRSPT